MSLEKKYSLGSFTKSEKTKLKKFLIRWLTGYFEMTIPEKIDEIIDSYSIVKFSGEDDLTFTFPFTIKGNDLLAGIGFDRRKRKSAS
jgi:hypothetical protein